VALDCCDGTAEPSWILYVKVKVEANIIIREDAMDAYVC
jgi:hypothetical protein